MKITIVTKEFDTLILYLPDKNVYFFMSGYNEIDYPKPFYWHIIRLKPHGWEFYRHSDCD